MNAEISCVKRGMIIAWSGSVASIPKGWALCDGNNGTPNLLSKFIRGAGGVQNPGDTGGGNSHNHAGEEDHFHSVKTGDDVDAGDNFDRYLTNIYSVGNTGMANNLPPYYAYCWIMKL